ncbi:MAG: hypothetical protein KF691_03075 [Phycisphaeraceae bacterium]|nr:hypothetical protein [Phycisphaeraceae bacterium]
MGCILVLFALFLPRVTLFCLWLFGDWLQRAFAGHFIWPLLGFFFAPYTTLAVAFANLHGGVQGGYVILVIIAALFDLGSLGGSSRHVRKRQIAG